MNSKKVVDATNEIIIDYWDKKLLFFLVTMAEKIVMTWSKQMYQIYPY